MIFVTSGSRAPSNLVVPPGRRVHNQSSLAESKQFGNRGVTLGGEKVTARGASSLVRLLVGTTSGRPRDDAGRNRHASLIARISNPEYPLCPETMRPRDPVRLRLQVDASWFETGGVAVKQPAHTLLVSRNGGVIRLQEKLFPGQEITLHRILDGEQARIARAKIVAEIDHEPDGFIYAIAILEPGADFWEIEFPAPHKAEEALARLLMECSFCQRREVVYLNEMELKSFEIRRCIARLCKHCDSPSIWVEAQSDAKDDD